MMQNENVNVRPGHLLPFLFPVSVSDAHVPIARASTSGQGSAWAPSLICGLRVFWHLSIRIRINLYGDLSYSSLSVALHHTSQTLLPTYITAPWPLMTLSLVHHCFFVRPLQTGNTPHELQFWTLCLYIFSASYTSTLRTNCSLLSWHNFFLPNLFVERFGKKLKHIFYNILTDPFSFYHVSCSLILIVQYCHWVSLNGVNCAIYFTTWNPTVWQEEVTEKCLHMGKRS